MLRWLEQSTVMATWVGVILFLLYETPALVYYTKFFCKIFPIRSYWLLAYEVTNLNTWMEVFRQMKPDSFTTKLVTCPYCYGFWLSLALTFHVGSLSAFAFIYLLGLLIYSLLTFTKRALA